MSAYYDLFEKPDIRQTGEQQPLYARFIPKGTIERKEFINRVHLFTGISRSLLEGAMAAFMDELCDCLADGWTVELGELGYFTPSLNCRREAMEKKELRAASVTLRGLNFRLGKEFYKELHKKMQLERHPQSSSKSGSSTPLLSVEQRFRLLDEYLQQEQPCKQGDESRFAHRSCRFRLFSIIDARNLFIEDGLLKRCGAGRNVVYMRKIQK